MKIGPIAFAKVGFKFCQIVNKPSKMAKHVYNLPKWWNLTKSVHTAKHLVRRLFSICLDTVLQHWPH